MYIDILIFRFINGLAGKWAWLDFVGIFFAQHLGNILFLVLTLFLIKDFKKYFAMVYEGILSALFIMFTSVRIFSYLHFRFRPFVKNYVNFLIPYDQNATSFPSSHASFYFALSTVIYCYNKKAGILFYIASIFIVLGRVFVGVHWPSDIIGGTVLGIIMGFLLHTLFNRINEDYLKKGEPKGLHGNNT